MDKQVQLNLSKAKQVNDTQFQIQIGNKDYTYQVPDDISCKDAVNKINNWVDKGVSQWGGLYDYIKRNFKLILESQSYKLLENDGSVFDITINGNKVTVKYLSSSLEYVSDTVNGVSDFVTAVKQLDSTVISPELVSNILDLASRFLVPQDYSQLSDFLKTAYAPASDVVEEPEESSEEETPEDMEDINPEDTMPDSEEQMPEAEESPVYNDPDLAEIPQDSEASSEEETPEDTSSIDVESFDSIKDAAASLDLALYVLSQDEEKYYVVGRVSPNDGSFQYLDLEEKKFVPLPLTFEGVKDIKTITTQEDIDTMQAYLDELQQIIMDLDMEVFVDE